ncbi:hypothetical protein [Rhizobium sp.]|uniref:hypothetical protein n=1 Tax=Rhizobium sp. TaxID=391 RepID=UPI0028A9BBE8
MADSIATVTMLAMTAVIAYRMRFYFIHRPEIKDWRPQDFKDVLTNIVPLVLLTALITIGGGPLLRWLGVE